MAVNVYAHTYGIRDTLQPGEMLEVQLNVAFISSAGPAVNDTTTVSVGAPNLISQLLVNAAIKIGVSAYVNSAYGESTTSLNIFLI